MQGLGFGVWGLGFGVWGFGVLGLGFGVKHLRFHTVDFAGSVHLFFLADPIPLLP